MRLNLPITNQEFPFPKGQTLVSTTDTKGRILYCNPMFIEVSGYTKEELLGQPHNMIRHPDMPEEAFRDMWETIASGNPWSAPVKNRRKNGDHYWVMANATPLMENGQPVGYMSVRTEATRAQIEAAESLYATMRAEKERGQLVHTLKRGQLVMNTWAGRLRASARLGLGGKFMAALLVVTVLSHAFSSTVGDSLPMGDLWGLVVDAVLMLSAWRYLTRQVVAPMNELLTTANSIAAGDLTQKITKTRDDQMGAMQSALGQLNVNLLSIVRDAREQSLQMVHGTAEIAQGNQDLSQRTESQASSLEETAASMTQITETVRQTADSSSQASALSAEVSDVAERSSAAVNQVGETMQEIEKASTRISDITQVIDSIAFQTNILALNAAVEAARAGEQGRGFAVVAAEVRNLAQRSAAAAKEIKQLIDNSVSKVQEGRQKTDAAKTTMHEAVDGVRRVNTLINEITHAANEQLSGISQINAAIAQLDTITQQNAALVEQISASAVGLEGMAKAVTETVQVFRLEEGGAAQRTPDAVALRKQMKPGAQSVEPRRLAAR